jgi:hypothetical protein
MMASGKGTLSPHLRTSRTARSTRPTRSTRTTRSTRSEQVLPVGGAHHGDRILSETREEQRHSLLTPPSGHGGRAQGLEALVDKLHDRTHTKV